MLEGLTKTYKAGGTVSPSRFVKFDGNGDIVQAAAATDSIIGVSQRGITANSGERIDVIKSGIAEVEFGGNVTRGGQVTSDASGKAVAAAPATGVNNRVGGIAEDSAVSGDIVDVHIVMGSVQG